MEVRSAIWLSERIAPATRTMDTLLKAFGGCEAVYAAEKNDYLAAGVTNEKTLKALLDKDLKSAGDTLARCERLAIRVIPYSSEEYPERLANVYAPPALLYAQGEPLDADSRPLISIVGTRDCTEYGRKAAYVMAGKLAFTFVIVVPFLVFGLFLIARFAMPAFRRVFKKYGEKKEVGNSPLGQKIRLIFQKIGVYICLLFIFPAIVTYVFYKAFISKDRRINMKKFFNLSGKKLATNVG